MQQLRPMFSAFTNNKPTSESWLPSPPHLNSLPILRTMPLLSIKFLHTAVHACLTKQSILNYAIWHAYHATNKWYNHSLATHARSKFIYKIKLNIFCTRKPDWRMCASQFEKLCMPDTPSKIYRTVNQILLHYLRQTFGSIQKKRTRWRKKRGRTKGRKRDEERGRGTEDDH